MKNLLPNDPIIVLKLTSACGKANSTTNLKDQFFLFWYGFKL